MYEMFPKLPIEIKCHPYCSNTDYQHRKAKGYSDAEILEQWDIEYAELSQSHTDASGFIRPIY